MTRLCNVCPQCDNEAAWLITTLLSFIAVLIKLCYYHLNGVLASRWLWDLKETHETFFGSFAIPFILKMRA